MEMKAEKGEQEKGKEQKKELNIGRFTMHSDKQTFMVFNQAND